MPHADYYIKQNDTSPALQVTLKDGNKNAVDVTGATVRFTMKKNGVAKVSESSVTLTTPASGIVTYSWAAGDTDTPGDYEGEFEVTFSGGLIETYPNSDTPFKIRITPELA